MQGHRRDRFILAVLILGTSSICNAAISQTDVAVAANQAAFAETFRVMVAAKALPRDALAYGEDYAASLKKLYATYDGKGEGAAFRRAVAKAADPQIAALRRIYSSGQQSGSGKPSIPLPSVVVASVRGSDETDTAARQKAALEIVRNVIAGSGRGRDLLSQPPDVAAWIRAYMAAEIDVQGRQQQRFAKDPCTGENCDRRRFFTAGYARNAEFQREVLTRHFSAQVASNYVGAKAGERAAIDAKRPPSRLSRIWSKITDALGVVGVVLGLFFGLAIFVWIIEGFPLPKKDEEPAPPPLSENYGTAAFAPPTQELAHPEGFRRGVFLGKSSAPGETPPLSAPLAPVFTTPEHHTLIVARTRTGKGTRVIVPTLLRYGGSVLAIDPKGENAAITGRARKALGQAVHIVNPWNELAEPFGRLGLAPATCNPLDVLDRDDPNAVAIAQALAATVCPSVSGEKDGFWSGNAANVLAAVLLWITDQPGEQKTLGRAREIVTRSREDFRKNYLARMMTSTAFSGGISEMVSQYLDLAPETYSGIMSNLSEATKFLSDPQVKASTAVSSFKMEDLIFGHTTVYLVMPPERMDTQKTWLRLVLTSAMQTIKKHRFARGRTGRCMFLIDEFAALGRMEDIPRDIATMSGYGLDMTLIVQGIDQLKSSYGDNADTILNNCAFKWFCNISDLSTAKYVSESLGNKTVRTTGKSHSANQSESGESEGESTSYGETGRPLMRPEEILTLGREYAIAFQPEGNPLFLQPIDYWNLTRAFDHMKGLHPRMYWEPPLTLDPNPYVQGADGEQQKQKTDVPSRTGMSEAEAREILEVGEAASRAEILSAYKRLMGKVHPDRGGSNFFAKQLNAARAVLLED